MKKLLTLITIFSLIACDSDEDTILTGDLTITFVNISGQSINIGKVGLFDIVTTSVDNFDERNALRTGTITNGTIEFNELNPGNYTVVPLTLTNLRMSGQVNRGNRTVKRINY